MRPGRAGSSLFPPGRGRRGRKGRGGEGRAVAAIMRARPGLWRLLLAARGRGSPAAMSRYSTEQRGRPNSPDYRLYFSK